MTLDLSQYPEAVQDSLRAYGAADESGVRRAHVGFTGRVADGPVCKLQLPERISSGTHSTWADGSSLRRWHETDDAAAAIGL